MYFHLLTRNVSFNHVSTISIKPSRQSLTIFSTQSILQKIGRVISEKSQEDIERFTKGMSKAQERMGVVNDLLTSRNPDDVENILHELEDALILSDFGPEMSFKIVESIRPKVFNGKLSTGSDIRKCLKQAIVDLLQVKGNNLALNLGDGGLGVILVVGVNGGGKTTTIGKLASKFQQQGISVMLAPGDTFRAAATEQLAGWAARSGAKMGLVRNSEDTLRKKKPEVALTAALDMAIKDGNVDLVICDTSGRLHTNFGLMEQLKKCRNRISNKLPGAPHEVLLVLDGTTGLNMLNQAKKFVEAVAVTGLVLTKLDGTARGGAILSVVGELGVPIKFVGIGESIEDLHPFDPEVFVESLLPDN